MCVRVLDKKKGRLFIVMCGILRKSVEKKNYKLECLLKNFERTHGDK